MNHKQREQLLASKSELDDFAGTQKRVKYYAMQLENFIETRDLDDLKLNPPKNFHSFIQELRFFDNSDACDEINFLLLRLETIGKRLTDLLISLPKIYKEVIWIIRDIFGHDANLFGTIELNSQQLNILQIAIKSKHSDFWPFIILSRYIKDDLRKEMTPLIIEYADHVDNNYWLKTGYACETLSFLKAKPKKSMECLSRHLNDEGCDSEYADKIIHSMTFFKKYDYMAVDALYNYLESLESIDDRKDLLKNLPILVRSRDVALIISPQISLLLNKFKDKKSLKNSKLFESSNETLRLLLMFSGQLQALINRDI
jgi:hypothetical protein